MMTKPVIQRFDPTRLMTVFPRAAVLLAFASILSVESSVEAQFYRGFRPRGAIVVPAPIAPLPGYRPYGPPVAVPFGFAPSPGVRVRTPYFSMNISPSGIVPPRVPSYSYRYESYRPSLGYSFGYSSPPMSAYPPRLGQSNLLPPVSGTMPQADLAPSLSVPQLSGPPLSVPQLSGPPLSVPPLSGPPHSRQPPTRQQYGAYQPGRDGGVPDVTTPNAPDLLTLRNAAETLRATLARRADEGAIWLEYLRPDLIVDAVDSGKLTQQVRDLATRYNGVTMNRELTSITRLAGFEQTRRQLNLWIGGSTSDEVGQQAELQAPLESDAGPTPAPAPAPATSPEQGSAAEQDESQPAPPAELLPPPQG